MADNIFVFDLETQRDLAEVGGRAFLHRVGVSVGVSYHFVERRFRHYLAHELHHLIEELRGADLVVGFNIKAFDYPVLNAYTDFDLASLPTCDIMDHVQQALGHRVTLDSLAQQTLGIRKAADGRMALRWWKDGQIELIRDYCQRDVDITRRLYEFGRDHGYLWSWDRRSRRRIKVPVSWSNHLH